MWPASRHKMNVGVADACAVDADDDIVVTRRGFRPLLEDERRVEPVENRCPHGCMMHPPVSRADVVALRFALPRSGHFQRNVPLRRLQE